MFATPASRVLALALLLAPAAGAQQEAIFAQFGNTTGIDTDVDSSTPGFFGQPVEAADDFDVVGTIERVYVSGYGCSACAAPTVAGVHVRFYEWTASGPGALQAAYFVPAGDPGFHYDASVPASLDITLPSAFEATGKHWLSVQMEFSGLGYWGWWDANYTDGPHGAPLMQRTGDGPWQALDTPIGPLDTDLGFALWGHDATPADPGSDPHGTWLVVGTPDPVTDHAILRDVEVIAADDVWAVGEWSDLVLPPYTSDTKPLAMHWDGASWTSMDVPFKNLYVGGNWCDLDAVRAAAPDDVWAAGTLRKQAPDGYVGTHLFVTRWNGTAWKEVPTPVVIGGSGEYVDDIAVVAPDDVWFVGDWLDTQGGQGVGLQKALTMHWNGSTMSIVENPFFNNQTVGGHGLTSISALASDDIWAVGGGHDGDYVAFSEITHWNGSTWEYRPGPAPGWFHRLYAVEAIAHDDVWATGDYQDAAGYHVFFIHWNGSAWTMVDDHAPGGGSSLVAFGPDEIYSSGDGIVRWDGASWTKVASFPAVFGPSVVALDSAGTPATLWGVGREVVVDSLLTLAVRLVSSDAWSTVPTSAADSASAPLLLGAGLPVAGQTVTITLAAAPPTAPTLLVAGLHALMLPLKGSVLVPSPDVVLVGPPTGVSGVGLLQAGWPAGIPVGLELYLQAWIHGPQGWIASDGLRAVVP